ncbi:RidA family protein [Desulfoferrobacter suflitae]|uniref:RidA family protein n=1 Tax=Desulfoferrobacter suflitae TaxID=2865782 RepID=UPI002164D6B9|nr:RidA family protein [Desulfoferrobacter suflitae]MCK8603982.1 RidA family protein [Desulfoferrobacter suflitae]
MSCQVIHTERAPAAIGPYSQAVKAGDWLFVSGQIGLHPETGELVSNDLTGQAGQALENLSQIVTAAGCRLTDVVAVDVYLTEMGQFAAFNELYQQVFSNHRPARAVVEVSALPKGALIEIKCIAHLH